MAGVRSSKTVGSTLYRFDTLSGQVTHQEWTDSSTQHHLYFIYDDSNQPYAVLHQTDTGTPTLYYYMLNLQGDVIGLLDANGNIAAQYRYTPWGEVTVLTFDGLIDNSSNTIGNLNPLRYRGYYYDTETGFYYLQSRYYDPTLGRFINADSYSTTDTQGFLSYNMFAYCENDPVMCGDADGGCPYILVGALIGAGCQLACDIVAIQTGVKKEFSSPVQYAGAALGGALTVAGVPAPTACNVAISLSVYLGDNIYKHEYNSITLLGALDAGIIWATAGRVGGNSELGKDMINDLGRSALNCVKSYGKKNKKNLLANTNKVIKASHSLFRSTLYGNYADNLRDRMRPRISRIVKRAKKRFNKWFWNGAKGKH